MNSRNGSVLILAICVVFALPGIASAAIVDFTMTLDGTQTGTGSAATGTGTATIDTDTNELTWNITFDANVLTNGSGSVTAAYFHIGRAGISGPAITPPGNVAEAGTSPITGSATITDADKAELMAAGIYLDIQTTAFAAGEIRGQLIPDSVTLPAKKDNTIFDDITLSNGSGDYLFSGLNNGGIVRRTLMMFDIAGSGIPSGSTITSATLTLYASRAFPDMPPLELHRLLADWGEGASDAEGPEGTGAPAEPNDATWIYTFYDTTSWANPGGDFEPSASASEFVGASGFHSWTSEQIVADVQSWLDEPSGNFGWLLRSNNEAIGSVRRFESRTNPTVANRPALVVQYEADPTIYVDANSPNDPGSGIYLNPFRKIQDALDAALDGDEIEIRPGIYSGAGNYDLDPDGKDLVIRSSAPSDISTVAATIIDAGEDGRGFYIHSGEDANCVIWGLTIQNCLSDYGSGILCENASPMIVGCIIQDNTATLCGGGVFTSDCNSLFAACIIRDNASEAGGGIGCESGQPIFASCLITGNVASGDSSGGGGVSCSNSGNPLLLNCTIAGNSAPSGPGGGLLCADSDVEIENSILWGNSANQDPQISIFATSAGSVTVSYSDVEGGQAAVGVHSPAVFEWGSGNIDVNPLFQDVDNYCLQTDSHCIDAGDPNYAEDANDFDLDGNLRVSYNRVDMGAYEFEGVTVTMSVVPTDDFDSSGRNNGPFSPSSMNYTVTNTGGKPLSWSVSKTKSWVSLSSSGGSLEAGESTSVIVSINSNANTLAVSATPYSDTVSFVNNTNGRGDTTISVSLSVLGPPTLRISAFDNQGAETVLGEPVNTGTFRISRQGYKANALTVTFSRSGTAGLGSTADYTLWVNSTALTGTSVVIPVGQEYVDITVRPVDNLVAEPSETVILTLTANAAYNLSSTPSERTATVTILDNEPIVRITASDNQGAETVSGGPVNTGTFRISREGNTANTLTVSFSRTGTGGLGSTADYTLWVNSTALTGTSVVIPVGQEYVDITVRPVDNLVAEPSETVILTLTANAAYNLSSTVSERTATVTILDNEP